MIAKNVINNDDASGAAPTIELSENFYINNNRRNNNVKIQVRLNAEGIYLRRETEHINHVDEQLIRLDDVIGSHFGTRIKKSTNGGISACRRGEQDSATTDAAQDTSAFLYIYAYVKQEKPLRRNRTVRILRFRSHSRYEDNLKLAKRWHRAILVNKGRISANQMLEEAETAEVEQKPMLILLNPKSGSGKGREMFHKQVAPVLKEAEMPYDLQITTHPNYARDLVRTRKDLLQRYRGIVVASGDGLFYEVLNGIMERADWRYVARHLPIGIIPCGSGNGLAKSIAHCYNEPYEPKPIMNATLNCLSGKTVQMDIVLVGLLGSDKQQTTMYSFLSVGWGLISDIDIESESLRRLGPPRFTLWTIRRLIHLRTYKGKISYIRCEKRNATAASQDVKEPNSPTVPENGVEEVTKRTNEGTEIFHDVPDNEGSYSNADGAADDDDDYECFADTISLDRTSHRTYIDSWHSATSRRTAYYSVGGQSIRSRLSLAVSMQSKIEAANAELEPHPLNFTIPAINMPLPEDTWHSEEGEYIMVHTAYTTHLSTDCFFAPESKLDDGIIYMMIIRAGVSRSQLLQFMLGLANGTHLPEEKNEFIEVVPVRAFRIEPQCEDGIITVDGERVPYGPIQGEILSGIINVMVPNGNAI